jgi:S-(hydroxymethyl)glutathione dehydrogenase / alcohol dehydrogenase
MRAAVMHERGADLVVEDLDLAAPRTGEVLVRLVATGVCHSDLNGIRGTRPLPLPMVFGHEGAGVVEAIGTGVTTVAPGDHVVLAAIARCGRCEFCVAGKPWLCSVAGASLFSGTLLDGTTRLSKGGQPVYHWFSQSSFAERAVVPEGAAVRVRSDVSLDKVATLACGVSTGLGSVFNAARVQPGERVAVIGCGGVGVSVVIGADLASAGTIVAVDIADDKLEFARSLGATHSVNAKSTDAVAAVREITGGGADHVFDCVASPTTLAQLVEMIRAAGHGYVVGAPQPGTRFPFPTDGFLRNKNLHGVTLGNVRPSIDIPRYVDLYARGRLPLDRLVTRRYELAGINEALAALETSVGRGVVSFALA